MYKIVNHSECLKEMNDLFTALTPMTNDAITDINQIFELKIIPKNTFVLKEGVVMNKIYFLNHGLLRSYFHRNGNECTTWFMLEKSPFTNFRSFITQQPSLDNIITLEECVVLETTRSKLYELYDKHHCTNTLSRIFSETYFLRHDAHVNDLLFSSAEERYKNFREQMPELEDKVKSKDLSSYLGMTKETLSRVRAKYK